MAEEKKKGKGKYPRGACVPKYSDPEEVQKLIDDYFKECAGRILTNDAGEPVFDKYGHPVIVDSRPPTITGLALALGFTNRQSLLNYQARPAFRDVITRAKSRVEMYTEERLFDKDGSNGAKFSLQFNFKGWREEKTDEDKAPKVNIICDIPRIATQDTGDGQDALDPQKISALIKSVENGGTDNEPDGE